MSQQDSWQKHKFHLFFPLWLSDSRRPKSSSFWHPFYYLFRIFFRCGPLLNSLLNLLQYCFCFILRYLFCFVLFFSCKVSVISAPWSRLEPATPTLEGKVLTHWTAREVAVYRILIPTLEEEMATHCSILAWRVPRTGEPGGLRSRGGHKESDTTERSSVLTSGAQICCISPNITGFKAQDKP